MEVGDIDVETTEKVSADEKSDAKTDTTTTRSNQNSRYKTFWASVISYEEVPSILSSEEDYKYLGSLAFVVSATDNYFRITDRGSSYYFEFVGGMTTFFSMAYIMVLNGVIIAGPFNTGLSVNGVFFATTLSSGIFTFMMGLLVNIPVALAPGMGLNGFFATIAPTCQDNRTGDINGTPCPTWGTSSLPWSDAMGAVFISGIFYLFFTIVGLRSMLFRAVPPSLRAAITVGIGFFITMIGLKIGEITRITLQPWALAYNVYPAGNCVYDSTSNSVAFCANSVDINFTNYDNGIVRFNENPAARIAVLGLAIVAMLETLKVRGSIIIAIVLTSFVGINYVHCRSLDANNKCVTNLSIWGQPGGPSFIVDTADIPSGKLTWKYANKPFFWDCVWTFLFVELFDSFGTLSGIMSRCGFMEGDPELAMTRVNRAMCVDGFGLALGGVIGANSITCFVESNTGVEAGARTGLASIVTGCAFLLSLLFVQPFVTIIPDAATTCALVMVGVHSLANVQEVNFKDPVDQLTAFFTVATMGFTYSIANGISAGFIFFTWMRTVRHLQLLLAQRLGRKEMEPSQEVESALPHPLMFVMALFMVFRFRYLKA